MGVMRFLIHPPQMADDCPDVFRAYISGIDGRVHPTRVEIDGPIMACRRPVSESGKLHVPWPVEGLGRPVLCTASLPEREAPYHLPVELARGKISQVRDQVSAWELQGMRIPREFTPLHREAQSLFARAAAAQGEPRQAAELANLALARECRAADLLADAYTQQRMAIQRRRSRQPPALLGCRLERMVPSSEETRQFVGTFSAAVVPVSWKAIEPTEGNYHWELNDTQVRWCERQKLLTYGGPLIDLSPDGLPAWLWQWDGDVLNLQSFLCDFVETAISRYYGFIRTWEIAARANSGGAMTLSEEDRLSLVARALEVARHIDQEIQLLITVDQPFGEYQARGHHRLSPFQFVDALARSGVGLTGVNLEFGVGYQPRGTGPRDRLSVSRLIDHWSVLGLPLNVTLAFPSSAEADPQADGDLEVPACSPWKRDWSAESQAEWLEEYVPMFLAKPSVVGVFWTHFSDDGAHHFPHAGMLNAEGEPKPALQRLQQFSGGG